MMGNKKLQVWLPLIFAVVMIMGMLLGYKLGNTHGGKFFASNNRGTLQKALDIIRMNYVDSIEVDTLQGNAIEEMMNELDPHSVYLPPVKLREVNEDLNGAFEGIGVELNVFSDTINIVNVIPEGPGDKAGIRIGDKVIKINDSLLSGKNRKLEQIKELLRGPKGSKAVLQVLREGKPQDITVVRNTIPVSAIEAAYMIDKTIGYIKLGIFSSNSYEDFMASMEALQKQGMQSLIFDLRGNGGGFMDEAVDMADEFLDGDKLVVYTKGVNSKKVDYRCKRQGLFEKGKLVLLVDESSASASEVLTGALQEWCRATIIGRRTFGKGLVQEQFPLGNGSAIRLTIARYYTPLGRSIQRPYEKGRKVYMDDQFQRYSRGELFFKDSNKINIGDPYITACRDTVYGGGGIMPNIFVPIDTTLSDENVSSILSQYDLSRFTYYYYLDHKKQMDQYRSATDYVKQFNAEAIWGDLFKKGSSLIITEQEKKLILLRLKASLAQYKWRRSGYNEVMNTNDNMINKALETIRK